MDGGLKAILFGTYKVGKTVMALSSAELGNVGYVDTERRLHLYTRPEPAARLPEAALAALIAGIIRKGGSPKAAEDFARKVAYANPRRLRLDLDRINSNPVAAEAFKRGAENIIWLVQSEELNVAKLSVEVWSFDDEIKTLVTDSASIHWDLMQDTIDQLDEKVRMLGWGDVKRFDRRYRYALMNSNKHAILIAQLQEKGKMVKDGGGKTQWQITGVVPWIEKKAPHWADLIARFETEPKTGLPRMIITGEGMGGPNGLCVNTAVNNPTFAGLVKRIGWIPPVESANASNIERSNVEAVSRVAHSPHIPGVDDAN